MVNHMQDVAGRWIVKGGGLPDLTEQKHRAAERAATFVEGGMLLGLGSGSTAEHFVRALAPRIALGLRVRGVATSDRTERIAREVGIPLVDLDEQLDLAVDGADAIARGSLAAIKGRGGAMTREKLVAAAAERFILIADSSKIVGHLSDAAPRLPVPVEVLPFGWRMTRRRLNALGNPVLRERGGERVITDNGNLILDLYDASLNNPREVAREIADTPGVVEHGLFLGMASLAIIASDEGISELVRE